MSTSKTIRITYSDFQATKAVTDIMITVTDSSGQGQSRTVTPGTESVTFDLLPGPYTVTAQATDETGAGIGAPAFSSFEIDAPVVVPVTITVQIPASVSVS